MCCSTTPKTKAASPAIDSANEIIKQATGAGEDAAAAGAAPLKFEGKAEHVPDLTFIVEPRVTPDNYLESATDYHANCGMNPQQIHSIDHLVSLLAADNTPLKRIRVVGHASGEDLLVPLFGQTSNREDRHAFKANLNAFAMSDERGLMDIFSLMPGQHFHAWVMIDILKMIRDAKKENLLKPFGLHEKGIPKTDDLDRFMLYSCDYAFVNENYYKKNNAPLSANEKAAMLKAFAALIGIKAKAIKGTSFNGQPAVTDTDLTALSDYLKQLKATDLNLAKKDVLSYNMPGNALNPFLLAGRAADAIVAGFRAQLEKVRNRFSSNSYIDIRGCRAGSDTEYLSAIKDFFGQSASKPNVTAPLWYQAFAGTNSYYHPVDRAGIHTLLQNGPHAADIRKGFATWATMCHVEPEHKEIWMDAVDGSAVKFVLLEWRKKLRDLPVEAPALKPYLNMVFIDFINKSQDFFNIAPSDMPKAAVLTDINNYITGKLKNYAKDLLQPVDGATDQAKLNTIHTALKTINTELGNPVTPFPPAPIGFKAVIDVQNELIKYISDKKIAEIKPFMAALKNRLTDTNDPGLYYYMLFAGMPVFVFSNHEAINNHVVKVINNALVILDSFADAAYRTWVKLSWEEPLPSGNRFSTLHPTEFTSRRVMMMVREPDGGDSPVAVCPHKDYMDKITSV